MSYPAIESITVSTVQPASVCRSLNPSYVVDNITLTDRTTTRAIFWLFTTMGPNLSPASFVHELLEFAVLQPEFLVERR